MTPKQQSGWGEWTMPEDGSPRPRPVRRLLLAISRAAALFILVTGIYGAATIAVPQTPLLNRAIASLLIGVVIFEMLRRPRRTVYVPSGAPFEAPPPDNREDLLEAQHVVDQLRAEADAARNRESQAREQYEREHENLQRAANRALEEIQRIRSANDELRGQLETQKSEAEKRARREVEEAKQKAEVEKAAQRKTLEADWTSKLKDVQRDLELTRSSAQQLLQSNEALKQQLDEERQRLHAELQRIIGESKSERDEMQSEARTVAARLEELLAQLERERKLSQELAATRGRLDEENAALRKRIDQEPGSQRHQLEAEWDAKLQKIVSELAADHENDLGEALAKREEARAEVRSLEQKIAHHEKDRDAMRQQIDTEWGAKLQKIVAELTTDHENDMGDAIAAREGARAELRSLNLKMMKLEEENASLKRQRTDQARPPDVDEKALRERIDAEWSEKLQTIVSHMATDHEADVGKAIEEREAARAELRNLSIKITSLQQKFDAERRAHDSLQIRLREAENQIRSAPTQPMAALQLPIEPPPPPEPEPQEEQRARADVLQFAEQAYEAIQRATSPGDVPLPVVEKKARILIVHHDPALRSMWRDNLGKSGFEVQTAADGLEGLRMVKAEKPDVVIADASMPKMDGRELCQLIKSNPETADVKVILMTGIYTTEKVSDGTTNEYDPDELLRKPVKPEAMKTALASLLAARVSS